jgi:hypothetical protein
MAPGLIIHISAQKNFGSLKLIQLRVRALPRAVGLVIVGSVEDTLGGITIFKTRPLGGTARKIPDHVVCDAIRYITTPLIGQYIILVISTARGAPFGTTIFS